MDLSFNGSEGVINLGHASVFDVPIVRIGWCLNIWCRVVVISCDVRSVLLC